MSEGSVHGRFQPFHNQHLEYLLRAKERCDFLWVGIVKPDTSEVEFRPLARHRERPSSNPLTYWERAKTITTCLIDAGISRAEFGFLPFPIDTPSRLHQFVSKDVICFTTICESWNKEKISVLEREGFVVEVLFERTGEVISASRIRESIMAGTDDWKAMVPRGTRMLVEESCLRDRLLGLRTREACGEQAAGN